MTSDQFQARVATLCSLLDIEYSQDANVLLSSVRERLEKHDLRQDEHAYLAALLLGHGSHVMLLGGVLERAKYSDCPKYLSPQAHSDTSLPLLAEIKIFFPTNALPKQFEIIAFPDLNVNDRQDDLLTGAYLAELDAAVIFQEWNTIEKPGVDELVRRLTNNHANKLGDRIWMVIGGWGDLTTDQLARGNEGSSTLEPLFETLTRIGMTHGRVLLWGNPSPDVHAVMSKELGLHTDLGQTFQEMLVDGGKGRLQRLVIHEILELSKKELEHRMREHIPVIRREICELIEKGRDSAELSDLHRPSVEQWEVALGDLRRWVRNERRKIVEEPASELAKVLAPYLDHLRGARDDDDLLSFHDFVGQALRRHAIQEATNVETGSGRKDSHNKSNRKPALHATYDAVEARIRQLDNKPIRVGVEQHAVIFDPSAEWGAIRKKDLDDHEWATGVFDALSSEFPTGLDPDDYIVVMKKKIRRVVYDYANCVSERIERHIDDWRRRIRLLSTGGETANRRDARVYDRILEQLQAVEEGSRE